MKEEEEKKAYLEKAERMYEELKAWRAEHPKASIDEIGKEIRVRREKLMGELLKELAEQQGVVCGEEAVMCKQCGEKMAYKGKRKREIVHGEGIGTVERGYHYCEACHAGEHPFDERLQLGEEGMTPETVKKALRLASEIPSYRRAAESYCELTHLPLSKSHLQALAVKYGERIAVAQAAEVKQLLEVPKREETVLWRKAVEPDSETMNVSMDGVFVHLQDEGWKEVKVCAISAVEVQQATESDEKEIKLSKHSYRAGLWEASEFANHLWAESERRGLAQAKRLLSINDGALWIWNIVFLCFAQCVQILDWWHAVQRLWTIATDAFGSDSPLAARWVEQQKQLLAQGHLSLLFRNIRIRYPSGQLIPDSTSKAFLYLFHNRHRMRYHLFRKALFPIGSGSVESACKVVIQQPMKQAGMIWSRKGASAMLALRSAFLSDRHSLISDVLLTS